MGWRTEVIWECDVDAGIGRLLDELARSQRESDKKGVWKA
jgi:G:T-mismatch repair DNA endonuclease (very short patch repair protein)